jgi:cytochrome P450
VPAAVSLARRAGETAAGLASLVAFQRDRLGYLEHAASAGGDVARFRLLTQPVVLLSHPDLARAVLVANQHRVRKSPVLRQARVVLGDGLLTAEGGAHRRSRRLVQPAFHRARIAGYAQTMVEATVEEARGWAPGSLLDVEAAMHRIALQVTGRTLFAADTRERAEVVRTAVDDVLAAYGTALLPGGALLRRLPIPPVRRLHRGITTIDALVADLLDRRRSGGGDQGDLLSMLLLARDPDAGALSDAEIRDEVVTLLLAGHETTAATLSWSLHLLAGNPDAQAAVHEEVDALTADPTAADLDALVRTRAVVAEALRLYPPSWGITRQVTVPLDLPGDVEVDAGAVVVVSPWVLHRDARWWVQPHRFAPERWAGVDPRRPLPAFLPFGAGTRMCVGEGFAWTEATLVLAAIARRWSWQPTGPMPRPAARLTLRPAAASPVLLVPRA